MARPTDYPDFATDATFTNGPDAGTATKIEPSAGELAEGNIRGTAPSAQKANWWQNNVGAWMRWIVDDVLGTVPMEPVVLDFTSDDNFTTESHVGPFAIVEGCGAGGPGGDGGDADTNTGSRSQGGGGGGGAPFVRKIVSISASTQYDVAIGSGYDFITEGTRGTPSTLTQHGGAQIASLPGGLGGISGDDTGNDTASTVTGGGNTTQKGILTPLSPRAEEQAGGAGVTNNLTAQGGFASRQGFDGGAAGANGTDASTHRGGGGGGGGGAGPYGPGADGGSGGNGSSSGPCADGNPGLAAAANTGAGGGGGGGAGHGTSGAGNAASGGDGGSGRMRVIYFRPITTA